MSAPRQGTDGNLGGRPCVGHAGASVSWWPLNGVSGQTSTGALSRNHRKWVGFAHRQETGDATVTPVTPHSQGVHHVTPSSGCSPLGPNGAGPASHGAQAGKNSLVTLPSLKQLLSGHSKNKRNETKLHENGCPRGRRGRVPR